MKKQELVQLILTKVEEIEELEARIKDQKGRAVMAKIICRDNQSAKRIENIIQNIVHTTDLVEVGNVAVVDEFRIEGCYLRQNT